MSKPVYVLGTGLSHDGSSCLLKDGKIIVAIEKERLTRKKHDGGNDSLTVQYCLNAAGITLQDVTLIVQAANFEKETIAKDKYGGSRAFAGYDVQPVSISHHVAHAYSAVATAPFSNCAVLVIDGCGSPYYQCDDLADGIVPEDINTVTGYFCEKDSFYHFTGNTLTPLFKDFARMQKFREDTLVLPTIEHSIGGVYSAASNYCFGNLDDAGKLMGLAPYGKDTGKPPIFILKEDRCFVDYDSFGETFINPRTSYNHFKKDFQHYADIAWWVQQETARAVRYIAAQRMQLLQGKRKLAMAGGVALNAVANASLLQQGIVDELYIQPAAADNGLAIGCAYYGWMKLLQQDKPEQQKGIFFGRSYDDEKIAAAIDRHARQGEMQLSVTRPENIIEAAAQALAGGKVIGWYRGGAEFGPRALGHRSILADPRIRDIQLIINRDVKNREDFRPFAPSVPLEHANNYFEYNYESPYMILTDKMQEQWKDRLPGVVHVDGSCRVQTVTPDWNKEYYDLLLAFGKLTGIYVLLNTSFNTRGMPIVETPEEAMDMFGRTALDELYIGGYRVAKHIQEQQDTLAHAGFQLPGQL